MSIEKNTGYLVRILRSTAYDEPAPDFPQDIDVDEFLNFCRLHKLLNVVYITIGDKLPENKQQELTEAYNKSLFISAAQQYYIEAVEDAFSKNGIDYLILKGKELSSLYPSEDMRQSADFDIYIGKEACKTAKPIMESIGFNVVEYSDISDEHDEYIADSTAFCELHKVLIQDNHPWREECNKIPQRLVFSDEGEHCLKMRSEDFYLYNLAHAAKHMKLSGIGIRAFFDQWLIYKKMGDGFDWDYLNKSLDRANLYEFDKNARALYLYWFEGKEPDNPALVNKMAEYVAKSGWVGTYEQFNATKAAENSGITRSKLVAKIMMCFKILSSPYESMVLRYPILKKHKWLTPFCRIHRGIMAVIRRRDLIKSVTSEIDSADIDFGKDIVKFKSSIGL